MAPLLLTNNLILDENTTRQVVTPAIEDTEDDTEQEDESYTDSTDEGTSTTALAAREQESVSRGRTKSKS